MAGELEPTTAISDALVILGAAGIVIPLFARFRITPVIGFLLIGILVGPYGLGALTPEVQWLRAVTISEPDSLDIFAEFGIILLLFTIGLELSFNRLWQMRKLVFGLGAAELLIIGSSIGVVLAMMGQYWTGAMALGLALALSSTAIVLPISGTSSPVGKAALSMLLFEDVAIVPIIFMLGALAPYAQADGLTGLWTTLWQGAAVVAVLLVAGRYVLPILFAQAARTKSPEVFLAATLVVVIGASLATGMAGLSPIVGAMIAGLLIAETDFHGEVETIIEPFKGLALGIFLITIGMSIDLEALRDNLAMILTAVILVLTFKAVVTGVLLRMMGARRNTATETGILMASPSETTLIVLSAASTAMLIQPGTVQFWQIVTAIGLTITPILAFVGRAVARRVDPVPDVAQDDSAPAGRVIVVGGGRVGRLVSDMLRVHDQPYITIESDADLAMQDKRDGYNVIFGNAARLETLRALRVEDAAAIVLTMDAPVLAQRLVSRLRKTYPDLLIVSRARDAAHAAALYKAGASHAVPETLESSLQLSEAVLVDVGVAMGPVIASIHEKRDEMRKQIQTDGALDHVPKLRTSTAPPSSSATAPAE
ncbi:cation:proton antiporter domain-containing protein [Alteriqipengyuania lutimaris]|uniref:Sodium:proton exchanger n=1 Tax=Alteriqipengyuania lutimaris TaxID=1538146 RepID=A0A395LGV9_9SPHN|nr:cation:proton antiporter [Alteriqipengyuania lutimaris]MBB3035228.1 CPA2 family monovalent cation:H+ antiporter-2 [Alteriqipengyuania lutimaris]RDS75829.1 sodium:proton exchanger [Alteriqipengyuania lutimaris]